MAGFVTRQTISQMFEPAISNITLDAIIRAEEATTTMNRIVNPASLASPDDEYGQIFIDKLCDEPMKTGEMRRTGIINGIRRVMIASISKSEITPNLICSIHNEVSESYSIQNRNVWRRDYVRDDDPEAIYAVPDIIDELMRHACFCYSMSSARPIIKAAALEAAIECIHPFVDANGRCARLTLALALVNEKIPPIAFPTREELIHYHDSTIAWIRDQNANPLLTAIAGAVEEEAKARTFFALF